MNSRTLFYRLRRRFEQYSPDGVHPKRRQARRGRPPAVSVQLERRVIALALAWARLIVGEVTAAAVLAFLTEVVRPGCREAGWRLQRVLTDNGLSQKSRRQSIPQLAYHQLQADDERPSGFHRCETAR